MTVRSVPRRLAPLLEELELEQPRVVTSTALAGYAKAVKVDWPVHVIAQRLRERGWLLPLRTRGVWEFAPAARAGAFGAGDTLIELRAVLARDPGAPLVVAAESAAYMIGLSTRRPEPETIGASPDFRVPRSLSVYRLVRGAPVEPAVVKDGLPVWSPATLLAFMASRPAAYHDWSNVGEWLPQATSAVTPGELAEELKDQSAGSWARAAYMLERGGATDSAAALMARAPKGTGPHYLGDRSRPGHYDARYEVVDSTGLEVTSR